MADKLAVAQFAAYVALTLASLTVAIVQLALAYRQHFGLKPFGILISRGVSEESGNPSVSFALIEFEFWNRRKYPMLLRRIRVKFYGAEIDQLPLNGEWHHSDNDAMVTYPNKALEQEEHRQFVVKAPFLKESFADLDKVTVTATLFDPLRNKHERISLRVNSWIARE